MSSSNKVNAKQSSSVSNMFALRRLDWRSLFGSRAEDPRLGLRRLCVNNNVVVVATTAGILLRVNLESGGEYDVIEVCRPEDTISDIFMDATGYHLIVGLTNGSNYYIHGRSNKAKLLPKLQGVVESVAFNPRESTETTTKSILVGTSTGQLFDVVIENGRERTCQQVFQFEDSKAVTSIRFDMFQGSGNAGALEYFVICVCSPPTRLYYFSGGPNFQRLFADYSKLATFTELPGPYTGRPKLVEMANQNQTSSIRFAVVTGVGVYQGIIHTNAGSKKVDVSEDAKLIPYPPSSLSSSSALSIMPIAMAATQYHFLLLTDDGKRLLALSSLDGSFVQSYAIKKPIGGNALDFSVDRVKGLLWLHTTEEIFQVTVVNEDRNVWKVYLAQALEGDEAQFDAALMACPKDKRHMIYTSRAEACLARGDHEGAALSFSSTNLTFEDVVLRLIGSTDSLGKPHESNIAREFQVTVSPNLSAVRIYIEEVMHKMPQERTLQRTMLCTWACEIFLHQIASVGIRSLESEWDDDTENILAHVSPGLALSLGKDRLRDVERELVGSFGDFLRLNKAFIDKDTVLAMFRTRSREMKSVKTLILQFAEIIGDYDLAVSELLSPTNEGKLEIRCLEAIDIMRDARFERVERLIYKYARTLIELQPAKSVHMLLQIPKLDTTKLLPALLHNAHIRGNGGKRGTPNEQAEAALYFLRTITMRNKQSEDLPLDRSVYHAFFNMLCQYDDESESELVAFLKPIVTKYYEEVASPDMEDEPVSQSRDNFVESLFNRQVKYSYSEMVNARETIVPFDVNFCLRLSKRYGRERSTIMMNLLLGRDIRALEDILRRHNQEDDLVQFIAKLPGSKSAKKDRVLAIAKNVISNYPSSNQSAGIKKAIAIMRESDGIMTIEDLLPHFPDSTEMDLFRDDMCTLLEKSSDSIKQMKEEMAQLSQVADSISTELSSIKDRGLVMENNQNCFYCKRSAFAAQFYLFPCGHAFHTDCVMENMEKHLDPQQLVAAHQLQAALRDIGESSTYEGQRLQMQRGLLREELDGYIAAECPLCGDLMVKSVAEPLFDSRNAKKEMETWKLK